MSFSVNDPKFMSISFLVTMIKGTIYTLIKGIYIYIYIYNQNKFCVFCEYFWFADVLKNFFLFPFQGNIQVLMALI